MKKWDNLGAQQSLACMSTFDVRVGLNYIRSKRENRNTRVDRKIFKQISWLTL